MKLLFNFFIFPGFLFSAIIGLFLSFLDRKITARLQYRIGPPWSQNFVDLIKLSAKEVTIPQKANFLFVLSPYIAILASNVIATILGLSLLKEGFFADLIVLVYLLIIPSLAVMLGASSSGNPLASVGVSREMKLILSYELPFILAILTVIIKSSGLIKLTEIITYQNNFKSHITSFSGFLTFLVSFICLHAKLGFVPFDTSEAEQEIMGGVFIEYSGFLLGLFKLAKNMLLYIAPLFLIILFWAKNLNFFTLTFRYTLIFLTFVIVKNTNPRLKIEQI
ncbi:MAG: NADH-quinone oxidoreductase subunit H, partial [Candidatus Omnitrophica bacterium]|nr:NADH-quinone oxidoreductase subunit H [Candidatus Omnitrophota bacterium]